MTCDFCGAALRTFEEMRKAHDPRDRRQVLVCADATACQARQLQAERDRNAPKFETSKRR